MAPSLTFYINVRLEGIVSPGRITELQADAVSTPEGHHEKRTLYREKQR
jgi:hypothetical protein